MEQSCMRVCARVCVFSCFIAITSVLQPSVDCLSLAGFLTKAAQIQSATLLSHTPKAAERRQLLLPRRSGPRPPGRAGRGRTRRGGWNDEHQLWLQESCSLRSLFDRQLIEVHHKRRCSECLTGMDRKISVLSPLFF